MKKNQKRALVQLGGILLDRLKQAVKPNPNAADPLGFRFDWHNKSYSITPTAK